MNEVTNVDIRQALNILSVAPARQLREVERFLLDELEGCKGGGRAVIEKTLSILAFVGCLSD